MTSRAARWKRKGLRSRLVRWTRLLVAATLLVALVLPANAWAALGQAEHAACCCPHPDDAASRRNCPCCQLTSDGDHCLPLGETSCSQAPFIAFSVVSVLVPRPVSTAEAILPDVVPLTGRRPVDRLERPPRLC